MPCILASLELSYTLPPMRSFTARLTVEILVAALGGALLISAFIANQPWLDRHFLPAFFVSRSRYVLVESFGNATQYSVGCSCHPALPVKTSVVESSSTRSTPRDAVCAASMNLLILIDPQSCSPANR